MISLEFKIGFGLTKYENALVFINPEPEYSAVESNLFQTILN
jgi:hypothetical protein